MSNMIPKGPKKRVGESKVEVWVMKLGLPLQELKHLRRHYEFKDSADQWAKDWNDRHVPKDPGNTLYEKAFVKVVGPRVITKGHL